MKKTFWGALLVAMALVGCGGGGGSPSNQSGDNSNPGSPNPPSQPPTTPVANQVPITINGAGSFNVMNAPMVSVTLCQPGTTNCVTIPNIIVDSGSQGLVLAASAVPSSLNLPAETMASTNDPIGGCTPYGGGIAWGPMVTADVQMAGEVAHSVPVQLAGATSGNASLSNVPSSCSGQGSLFTTASSMASNGILGVAGDYGYSGTSYFDCTSSACNGATIQSGQALTEVVGQFGSDNNGVILSFDAVPAAGAPSATGTMTFGLNTQGDNQTAGVTMTQGLSNASMNTTYNGVPMTAILDSGSFGEILGSAPIATCEIGSYGVTWFCPTTITSQSASYQYQGGGSPLNVTFLVDNAQTLLTQTGTVPNYAIPNLGMQEELFGTPYLDLGLSFLFGKTLYIGYPLDGAVNPTIGLATTASST